MANIAAADVKKLRDLTGAGMMECKKALEEVDGNIEAAVEHLRITGAAKAAKRGAERTTSNGLVASSGNVVVEILCETDFVAKNADFQALSQAVADLAADIQPADAATLSEATMADGQTVAAAITGLSAVIGEKIELGRVGVLPAPTTVYLHKRSSDLPAQVAVLIAYSGSEEAAKGAAMQVAAMRPLYVTRDQVPAEIVESEARIAEATAIEEGKPAAALPKIVEGRVNGFFKDTVLLEQASVVDNKKSVQQVLADAGTEVTAFVRLEVGQA